MAQPETAAYRAPASVHTHTNACQECGGAATGRQRFCSSQCRVTSWRRARRSRQLGLVAEIERALHAGETTGARAALRDLRREISGEAS